MKKNIMVKCLSFASMLLIIFVLSSCEGMFGGVYDDTEQEGISEDGSGIYGFVSYDTLTGRGTLYLDLSDYNQWTYLSFKTGNFEKIAVDDKLTGTWDGQSAIVYQYVRGREYTLDTLIPADAQTEPAYWDLALHRYEARTSNGAYMTQYTSLNDLPANRSDLGKITFILDSLTDNLVMTDISSMFNYRIGYQKIKCSRVLSSWLDMDISNPPPVYTLSDRVYLVRFADNSVAALHLDSYMDKNGTKGFLTISFIYPY